MEKNYIYLCDNDNCFCDQYNYMRGNGKSKCYLVSLGNLDLNKMCDCGTIISLEQVCECNYDKVIIFSYKNYLKIKDHLIKEFRIEENDILEWYYYIFVMVRKVQMINVNVLYSMDKLFYYYNIHRVLDIDFGIYRGGIKSRNIFFDGEKRIYDDERMWIDSIGIDGRAVCFPNMVNLYNSFKETYSYYDVVLFLDLFLLYSFREFLTLLKKYLDRGKYIYISLPEWNSLTYREWNIYDYSKIGYVIDVSRDGHRAILIERKFQKMHYEDVKIYVVNHTEIAVREDDIRRNIFVGANRQPIGELSDATGDNIAILNETLNELTAMYWIWKNTDTKYVGIEHYRRTFMVNPYMYDEAHKLDGEAITQYLENYDFIVAKCGMNGILTVEETIRLDINEKLFEKAFNIVREIVIRDYNDYLDAFDACFTGYTFYPCNLLVTRKEQYDEYCSWLFSIILESHKKIDLRQEEGKDKRVLGYIAERLLTVWLMKHDYKILELHYTLDSRNRDEGNTSRINGNS